MASPKSKTTGRAAPEASPDGAASPENAARMAERVAAFAASARHGAVTGYMRRLAASPPQVLLLEGGTAAERLDAAFFWAVALNCPNASQSAAPCLACPECLRLLGRTHRDLFLLDGSEGSIKIEEVREVRSILGEAPREAKKRVVILAEAQSLTEAAANAMLKSLEEPRPDTAFILLAPQRERLLPTLVSRSWVLTLAWPASSGTGGTAEAEESVEASPEAAQTRAEWQAALVRFFQDGRGLMDRTGSRAIMDAQAARVMLSLLEQALAQALAGQAQGALAQYFAGLPPNRQRMADSLLAEAQDSLIYTVNPALVAEWLAVHLFLLKPRGR